MFDAAVWTASLVFLAVLVANEAMAGEKVFSSSHPKWRAECGSCHIPYPAELLPATAWRSIMARLDRHFGTDASLDAATAQDIGAFLQQHAANGKFADARSLRITDSRWFRHEHEQHPRSSAAARSMADCAACHPAAERGNFHTPRRTR